MPENVFPSDTALLKALYLATFEATKKWTSTIRNWAQVNGELSYYVRRTPPRVTNKQANKTGGKKAAIIRMLERTTRIIMEMQPKPETPCQ